MLGEMVGLLEHYMPTLQDALGAGRRRHHVSGERLTLVVITKVLFRRDLCTAYPYGTGILHGCVSVNFKLRLCEAGG